MAQTEKQSRDFYIFDPITEERIPVTEEQFREYYRPINRIFAFAKRHCQCACHHWWRCGGDCTIVFDTVEIPKMIAGNSAI